MTIRVLLSFLTALYLISCKGDGTYGGANTEGSAGFTTKGYSQQINSQNFCESSTGKWGGVTCTGGTDRDPGFLGYLSNGTDTSSSSATKGVESISCNPKNDGGILFQLRVVLNSPFNSNGDNKNLTMVPASSQLELVVHDSMVGKQTKSGKVIAPIGAVFKGISGTVNGNKAINLKFSYTGNKGRKEITLNGTFDNELFTGEMRFANAQYWDGRTPGASGVLGKFRIRTCAVFSSN